MDNYVNDALTGFFLALLFTAIFIGLPIYAHYNPIVTTPAQSCIVAGVLRPQNGVWDWIDDDNHTHYPQSATVAQDASRIIINYGFTARKTITFIAAPDETTAPDYAYGASVTRHEARIYIYRDGQPIAPDSDFPLTGNIWIYGVFECD